MNNMINSKLESWLSSQVNPDLESIPGPFGDFYSPNDVATSIRNQRPMGNYFYSALFSGQNETDEYALS